VVTNVVISCNPNGTVHFDATVVNSGSCTTVQPWKAQLEQHVPGTGGFTGVRIIHGGPTSFPPGTTHVTGDFDCYEFPSRVNVIRVEFAIDAPGSSCTSHKKSDGISPCAQAGGCPLTFPDVRPDDPFYTGVMGLQARGVVSGYADGNFHPNSSITRAQVAKIVVLAFGLPLVSGDGHNFSDVASGSPFAAYIDTAYANGLVSGYADGTYRPNSNVTRGQIAKIIVSAAGLKLVSPATPSFSDVSVGSSFYSYIETAHANGLLSGYLDGTFRSGANATRGQVSRMTMAAAYPPQE